MRYRLIPVLLALVGTAACGGSGGGDAETACDPLRAIHEIDQRFAQTMDDVAVRADFEAFRRAALDLESELPEMIEHYDRAAELATPDVAEHVVTLRDGTVAIWDVLFDAIEGSRSADDALLAFQESFQDRDIAEATIAAATATLALDGFTTVECGFAMSD